MIFGARFSVPERVICTIASFYSYYQNPSGFCFPMQIRAFIILTSRDLMKGKDVLKCGLSSKKISSSKWPINVVIKGNQSVNRSNSPTINQSARETASELMIDSESQWTIGSRCSPKQF